MLIVISQFLSIPSSLSFFLPSFLLPSFSLPSSLSLSLPLSLPSFLLPSQQQRKLDSHKKRQSRALSGVPNSESGENFEELISKLTSGEAFKDFGQGKKRAKRVSSNAALIHAWNQISRDRIALSEAAGVVVKSDDTTAKTS